MNERERNRIEAAEHFRTAFKLLGFPMEQDSELQGMPERVTTLYQDLFAGMEPSEPPELSVTDYPGSEMVIIRDITFYSMCAHHLLPFFGRAHVGYVPAGKVVGLGSLPKVLEFFSRRPQLQERLAEQVADFLGEAMSPAGLIVHLNARHMCMEMRGLKNVGSVDYTASRGVLTSGELRQEFFKKVL